MATSPVERLATRLAYGLAQAPRVAWYLGHGYAMRRIGRRYTAAQQARADAPAAAGEQAGGGAVPSQSRLYRDLAGLFARDLANVEAGLYPVPAGEDGGIARRMDASRLFFADIPFIAERRREKRGQEVYEAGLAEHLPRYYRQNFHFQTDGWLSERSARLYDIQVETLFAGAANVMRRQALPVIGEWMRGRDQRGLSLLDAACGTGTFLGEARRAFPGLAATGLDLSEAYLGEARKRLKRRGRTGFVNAKAEAMPLADGSVDIVACVFLFHELPPRIRRDVAGEIARVLKPGGLFVMVDSLQLGDVPDYDGLLRRFPEGFHEPYYASYLDEDLAALFGMAGLTQCETRHAWLSKVVGFGK